LRKSGSARIYFRITIAALFERCEEGITDADRLYMWDITSKFHITAMRATVDTQ
jgi:hypothetical protein